MNKQLYKKNHRASRHRRIRMSVSGTTDCPRAAVFKSNQFVYVQIIDDKKGKTIVGSALKGDIKKGSKGTKTERAFSLGEHIGKKAVEKGVTQVVFDRGGFAYHGRVKAVADGLRKAGLKF